MKNVKNLILLLMLFGSFMSWSKGRLPISEEYEQRVKIDAFLSKRFIKNYKNESKIPFATYVNQKVIITVSDNDLKIESKKGYLNFIIKYDDILSVKRTNALLIFPNLITLKTKRGEKLVFFTYKRRELIDKIRAKLKVESP